MLAVDINEYIHVALFYLQLCVFSKLLAKGPSFITHKAMAWHTCQPNLSLCFWYSLCLDPILQSLFPPHAPYVAASIQRSQ